jgi:GTPase involved in cell partitioning and DNA repair
MNFKIVFAAAMLLTGTTFESMAQQKGSAVSTAAVTDAKALNSKLSAFEKSTSDAESAVILADIQTLMKNQIVSMKEKIVQASNNGENAKVESLEKQYAAKMERFNKAIRLMNVEPGNKQGIVAAVKAF